MRRMQIGEIFFNIPFVLQIFKRDAAKTGHLTARIFGTSWVEPPTLVDDRPAKKRSTPKGYYAFWKSNQTERN